MTKLERPTLLILADPSARQAAHRLFAAFDRRGVLADVEIASGEVSNTDLPQYLCLLLSPGVSDNLPLAVRLGAFIKSRGRENLILVRAGSVIAERAIYPGSLRFERGTDDRLSPIEPLRPDAVLEMNGKDADTVVAQLISGRPGLLTDGHGEISVLKERGRASAGGAGWGRAGWAAAAGFAVLSIGLGVFALDLRSERGELLVARQEAEFEAVRWLTTLEETLPAEERRAVFRALGEGLLADFAEIRDVNASDDELSLEARLLHAVGDARLRHGDVAGAETAFEAAAAHTAALLQRQPRDPDRIYDHAQSVFWVGNAAFLQLNLPPAAEAFATYRGLAEQLYAIDPTNPVYRAERGYSLTNAGAVALARGEFSEADTLFGEVITLREDDLLAAGAASRRDLANAYAWRADAARSLGELQRTRETRERALALYLEERAANPSSYGALQLVGVAHRALASVLLDLGELNEARTHLDAAEAALGEVLEFAPDNAPTRRHYMATMRDLAEIELAEGRVAQAQLRISAAQRYRLEGEAGTAEDDRDFDHASFDLVSARVALARQSPEDALALALRALAAMERQIAQGREYRRHYAGEARLLEGDALAALGRRSEAERAWRAGLDHVAPGAEVRDRRAVAVEAMLRARLGEDEPAQGLRMAAEAGGFRRPFFEAFWIEDDPAGVAELSDGDERDDG